MQEEDQHSPNDIAIVGMALRVPGARNVREFWENLCGGVESVRDVTAEELLAAGESASRMHQPNYVRRTSELQDMEMFDAEFFGMSPKEAAIMDPQHRHFLECAWEAMEDAGRTPDSSTGQVGVFAGCGMGSYFYFNVCSNRQLVDQVGMFLLRHTGNDKDFLATRASFAFDLRGPSVNVQTACSTSLVAIHTACQSLMAGECEMALAGGVTIELPHRRGYLYQDGEILSTDGHCRAFDHQADGTVFGSGVGVVVLRRLADALADGDMIHGVIKATAVNNDGSSKAGYLAPSVTGQAEAIIEAQGLAGVPADSIQYVECHGTGTYLGDPIEIEALTLAFRQSTSRTGFCRVGSVKTNIGHLDTAAGVVSVIKAVLSLKHAEIPPSLNFEKPNPAIDFARSPFIVNDTLTPWPATTGPRRAAVNSLGVGGTNAHAILEQAPARATGGGSKAENEPKLFVFAAKNRKALEPAANQMAAELTRAPDLSLDDASYTLFAGRKHFEHRRVVAARGREDAIATLSGADSRRVHTHAALDGAQAAFLFPGGGAQHRGMARVLYGEDTAFRAIVDEGLSYLAVDAATQIRRVWLDTTTDAAEASAAFLRPSLQLPAILIVEVAVARAWIARGVTPAALIGHSMGENAAACIAGVMSFREAVNLVRLRGELFDTVEPGGMLSVPLSADALLPYLWPLVDLASVNAPELCVVSGRNDDLAALAQRLAADGIDTTRVPIDIAAHSHMLEPILGHFEAFLRGLDLKAPTIPIVSNLTGDWLTAAEACDAAYWVRHLRSTVHFAKGLALLAAQANRIYIEVGPGRALSSLAKLQPGIDANQVINSLPHPDDAADDQVHLLGAMGRAWAVGLAVPLDRLWQDSGALRVSLPTYPFQRQRYFIDRVKPALVSDNDDEFLPRQADLSAWGYRPTWKQALADITSDADGETASWLVFLDDTGLGERIVQRLRAKGHSVATVLPGDGFVRHDASSYTLSPEEGLPGYSALLSALTASGAAPTRVLHMWLVTGDNTFVPGSNVMKPLQERGFESLLNLTQAFAAIGADEMRWTVVTNGMQKVSDEPLPYPEKATVLGPAQVLPKEMPGISVRVIDLDTSSGDTLVDQLWDDLFAAPASEVVAYRRTRRWVAGHDALPLLPADPAAAGLRSGGVYLITGGMGDIALALAERLFAQTQARLVLMGRSALPPASDWPLYCRSHPRNDRTRRAIEAISALEASGAEIMIAHGNVGDPNDLDQAIAAAEARFGTINGVFHAAGLVDDNLIQLKTLADAARVMTPKVAGTAALDRAFRDRPLDFMVLFSSTSTDTAPAGQADYVAANAYLNAYADSQAGRADRRTTAIHWGIWNEIGLAARATAQPEESAETVNGPADGPFFQHWIETTDGEVWIEATVSPETHWMLDEHRLLSGRPILPGTGYVDIIAQAIREYGFAQDLEIADLFFLKPLDVADGTKKRVRVRIAGRRAGHHVEITAGDPDSDVFTVHAEATLRPARAAEPADTRAAAARLGLSGGDLSSAALKSVQEDHIRFGPRWQVLRARARGDGEAVAELSLHPDFAAEPSTGIVAHPALLDIATGFALDLAPSYGSSKVLWAPVSYGSIRLLRALPASLVSWVRLDKDGEKVDGFASFDISLSTTDGTPVAEISRLVMKRLDDDLAFTAERREARPPVSRTSDAMRTSPAARQLAARVGQGIRPEEGFETLLRALATGQRQPIISSMDLHALKRHAAARAPSAQPAGELFERPELESDYEAPRNDIERTLAGFWTELLGIERIGINDSFFDIGGHSLIAVRLFRMIKAHYAVDLPISVLFDAPTIAACALLVAERTGGAEVKSDGPASTAGPGAPAASATSQPTHLVAMSQGRDAGTTPLFVCAGMFGNVLNLRQLALHVGSDRPVYGLQARGLSGDQEPHEDIVEMARANLIEVRSVQPHGPYLLGGFSGGGLVAYEMAQQLKADGEEVAQVIMLDTPLPTQPPIRLIDKLSMKLQDLRRERGSFLKNWLASRREWRSKVEDRGEVEASSESLHNSKIEDAFRLALVRYEPRPYDGAVLLLRPKLEIIYTLPGGRRLQPGRNLAMDDNGWTPYVERLTVVEVPGDHDSMVLEPFVYILADRVRRRLNEVDRNPMTYAMAAE